MKQLYKILMYLTLILTAYALLHVYHPNPENTTDNWDSMKDMFYDDNGRMYFLNYDSYFYVNNANMLYDGRMDWQSADLDFQTLFLYVDKLMFGDYFLSYYLSFIVGIFIVVLLYCLCYKFTNSPEASFFATVLFTINEYFFANTVFNYVDNTVVNLLLFMLLFAVMVSELKYWQKWLSGTILCWFFVLNWNGAFLFYFILILFFGLWLYYKKIDVKKYKYGLIVAFCGIIIFCMMFYFSHYYDLILTYFSFENSNIVELKHFSMNLFYLVLFIIPLMFVGRNLFKNELELKKIVLMSFLIVLAVCGFWYIRLFIYVLPFVFIAVAVSLKEIDKWYYNIILFIVLIVLYYVVIPFSAYDGGQYGVPFMDDSIVKTGEWIKANTPEDTMIVSCWDYCLFYEVYAERICKYKSSPYGSDYFFSWLYNTNEEKAVKEINSFFGNSIVVVDAHWATNGVRDAIRGNRIVYPSEDSIYYKLINNQNISNLTLLHEEYGGRLKYYYVYEVN